MILSFGWSALDLSHELNHTLKQLRMAQKENAKLREVINAYPFNSFWASTWSCRVLIFLNQSKLQWIPTGLQARAIWYRTLGASWRKPEVTLNRWRTYAIYDLNCLATNNIEAHSSTPCIPRCVVVKNVILPNWNSLRKSIQRRWDQWSRPRESLKLVVLFGLFFFAASWYRALGAPEWVDCSTPRGWTKRTHSAWQNHICEVSEEWCQDHRLTPSRCKGKTRVCGI